MTRGGIIGHIMLVDDFLDACYQGAFIDDDGYAEVLGMQPLLDGLDQKILPSDVTRSYGAAEAWLVTHYKYVVWYNR